MLDVRNSNKINLLFDYIHDNALIVSRDLNIPMGEAKELVQKVINEKIEDNTVVDPVVTYIGKNQFGDSVERKKKLTTYLKATNSGIVVPSGTVYTGHDVEMSIHTENTEDRVKKRAVVKKEGHVAEIQGNLVVANIKDTMQKGLKTINNSFTGLLDNQFNPFYRPSSHYSLTSMTATETSIGNSISESMVAGNRLYDKPEVVTDHILSTATVSNLELIQSVVSKYNLYIPTVDDCMYVILKSTRFYWASLKADTEIREILSKLTDMERVAFVYVNDLFHFRYFNEKLMRSIVDKLLLVENNSTDIYGDMKSVPEDVEILTRCILYDVIIDHSKRDENISFKDDKFPETKLLIASTAKKIVDELNRIDDLINAFFRTPNLPINVSSIKNMVRKCTILSDTDSTCSTYQDWVMWYHRRSLPKFSSDEIGISNLILLFTYRTLSYSLNMFCDRMNIKGKYGKLLAMKNEFYWKAMIYTTMTKHYYADAAIKEGSIFKKTKLELKGSNLIDSKLPTILKELSESYFKRVLRDLTSGRLINLHDLVYDIAGIELAIIDKFKRLDADVMKEENISDASGYKEGEDNATYKHYLLWNSVFGEKYGNIETLPVVCVKLKTGLDTIKKIDTYVDTIPDEKIRNNFKTFLKKNPMKGLTTLRLPKDIVSGIGIPEELESILDIRPLVLELCKAFYRILETVGYFKKTDILLSDIYDSKKVDLEKELSRLKEEEK